MNELPDVIETNITRGDYEGAHRMHCQKCLVALAIRRVVPNMTVEVSTSPCEVWVGDTRYDYESGISLAEEFDAGEVPERLIGRKLKLFKLA